MNKAKSSIHIEPGHISVVNHNDRSTHTVNSIFHDEKNEYSCSGRIAMKKYHAFLKPRLEAYTKKTGQKLNKTTITHLSAVVNIKKETSMKDLQKLAHYLETKFGTAVFQIAIHRDEGHINNGINVKNYHAHIEMLGIDTDGFSIRRKLTKSSLSKLQDKTAEILEMDRGINYAKEKKKRPKRLGTYEYKEYKRRENITIEALKKKFSIELNHAKLELTKITQQKKNIDSVILSILSQFELKLKGDAQYTYDQIKNLIVNKFKTVNEEMQRVQKENNTHLRYLKNAKKMYLDLQRNNSDLTVSLQETNDQLNSSLTEISKLSQTIEFLENQTKNNKNSINYKSEYEEEDEDEDNLYRFGY